MKLSIIIVNYKVKYFIEQSLISVYNAIEGLDTEIFVVDNNSCDDSIEYLSARFPDVKYIANKENTGFSKANNQAVELAKGEYILFLNPDTLVGNDVLQKAVSFMDANDDAGALGVKMLDGRGNFLRESKRGFPTPWVSFCKIFGLSAFFPNTKLFGKYHLNYLHNSEIHQIDVISGAFMMVRKTFTDKYGAFDEDFFMYGEDIDLSYRVTLAGYKNYYLPYKILHYKGESTKKDIKYIRIFYSAMYIFFKKHFPNISSVYGLFIKFAIFARAIVAGIKNVIYPVLKSLKPQNKESNYLICAAKNIAGEIETGLRDSKDDMRSVYYNLSIENIALDIFNNNITDIVLSDSDMSFSQMLDIMDMFSDKGINFHIHTLKSNTVISSNCAVITINKVMERTSDYQLSENIITETAFRNAD